MAYSSDQYYTKQKVSLMQAFLDGKTICRRDIYNLSDVKELNYEDGDIDWDFSNYLYEVKKNPEYIPFEMAEDLYNHGKQHGFIVRQKDDEGKPGCNFEMIITWDNNFVDLEFSTNYDDLFKNYVWADDNSPCGMLK